MRPTEAARVGYVLKRYPRYSETFIVNEICALEADGLAIEIFSLWPPADGHFQDTIAQVRAPVHYVNHLPVENLDAIRFWTALSGAGAMFPGFWDQLAALLNETVLEIYQAALLACQARQRGINHLHAHFASIPTTVARLAARFAGLPYSFTAHAKDIFHESIQPEELRLKLADAAAVVTVSDYNVAYLRDVYGPSAARVQRIYNGLDLARFPYSAPLNRPPLIIAAGRLVEKKGFADLIEACAILERTGREFRCQIIGAGGLEDDLTARIDRLGLRGRVEMLGPRPQNELVRYVQSAALFAAPCVVAVDSDRDGLPTVLLEAMALGTPCVATDVTGIPEVLRDWETGLMVPQHDPPALAAAIERLLANPALGVRLAAPARRMIEAQFDVRRNAAAIRAIFYCANKAGPYAAPLDVGRGI